MRIATVKISPRFKVLDWFSCYCCTQSRLWDEQPLRRPPLCACVFEDFSFGPVDPSVSTEQHEFSVHLESTDLRRPPLDLYLRPSPPPPTYISRSLFPCVRRRSHRVPGSRLAFSRVRDGMYSEKIRNSPVFRAFFSFLIIRRSPYQRGRSDRIGAA